MSYTGQPLKRFEDPRLVTGRGSFVDDIHLPGMLYAAVLRSPHAHTRILAIDVSAARHLSGVVTVLTGEDTAGALGMRVRIVADLGTYFLLSTPWVPFLASHRIAGPYRTPEMRIEVLGVFTNKPPTGAYRGAGGPEAAFCRESVCLRRACGGRRGGPGERRCRHHALRGRA